jgi:hypothetical protein
MSLMIELSAAEEARLTAAAEQEAVAPEEMARKLVTDHLPPLAAEPPSDDPTLVLFRQWEQEGTARTAGEAVHEIGLWEQFQANVNETRAALGMRKL